MGLRKRLKDYDPSIFALPKEIRIKSGVHFLQTGRVSDARIIEVMHKNTSYHAYTEF